MRVDPIRMIGLMLRQGGRPKILRGQFPVRKTRRARLLQAQFALRSTKVPVLVVIAGADGSDPVPLVRDARVNIFPKWTPDGEHLIYSSWDGGRSDYRRVPVSGGAPVTLVGNAADYNFDVGGDGRLLLRDRDLPGDRRGRRALPGRHAAPTCSR